MGKKNVISSQNSSFFLGLWTPTHPLLGQSPKKTRVFAVSVLQSKISNHHEMARCDLEKKSFTFGHYVFNGTSKPCEQQIWRRFPGQIHSDWTSFLETSGRRRALSRCILPGRKERRQRKFSHFSRKAFFGLTPPVPSSLCRHRWLQESHRCQACFPGWPEFLGV